MFVQIVHITNLKKNCSVGKLHNQWNRQTNSKMEWDFATAENPLLHVLPLNQSLMKTQTDYHRFPFQSKTFN